MLKSEMPSGLDEQAEFDHIITMFWEREKGQVVHIRVAFSPDQYRAACGAHKDGRRIRVQGIPEKAGKFLESDARSRFCGDLSSLVRRDRSSLTIIIA